MTEFVLKVMKTITKIKKCVPVIRLGPAGTMAETEKGKTYVSDLFRKMLVA